MKTQKYDLIPEQAIRIINAGISGSVPGMLTKNGMQAKLFDDYEQLQLPAHLMDYTPHFLTVKESRTYLETFIRQVPWQQQKLKMYEQEVPAPRLSAWFGAVPLQARKKHSSGLPWTDELLELRAKVEAHTGNAFNAVLLNFYRNGSDAVSWHSDKETVPGASTEVASLSLGQVRSFDFRNKSDHKQRYALDLENGSLLLMKGDLQLYWEHRIARSLRPMQARVNLTFRQVS